MAQILVGFAARRLPNGEFETVGQNIWRDVPEVRLGKEQEAVDFNFDTFEFTEFCDFIAEMVGELKGVPPSTNRHPYDAVAAAAYIPPPDKIEPYEREEPDGSVTRGYLATTGAKVCEDRPVKITAKQAKKKKALEERERRAQEAEDAIIAQLRTYIKEHGPKKRDAPLTKEEIAKIIDWCDEKARKEEGHETKEL